MHDSVSRHLRRLFFQNEYIVDLNHGHPYLFRDIHVAPAHAPYLLIIPPVYGPTAPADENWDVDFPYEPEYVIQAHVPPST